MKFPHHNEWFISDENTFNQNVFGLNFYQNRKAIEAGPHEYYQPLVVIPLEEHTNEPT